MINNVVLMGRLTADPELKTTQNGYEVCSFCIALTRRGTEKNQNPTTDFINIVAWNSTAKFVCDYFKKGHMIALCGRIQTRKYTDKYDQKEQRLKLLLIALISVAAKMKMCLSRQRITCRLRAIPTHHQAILKKLLMMKIYRSDRKSRGKRC